MAKATVTSGLGGKTTQDFSAEHKADRKVKEAGKATPIADPAISKGAVEKLNPQDLKGGTVTIDQGSKAVATYDEAIFEDGPTGMENITGADLLIPRITILQALSPQLNQQKAEYIPGAAQGDICDVETGEIFKSLYYLPCYFANVYLEWGAKRGQGLINNHGMDTSILAKCKQDEKRRYVLPSGNFIAQTSEFWGLNLSASGRRSFLPMTSTFLRTARQWNMRLTEEKVRKPDGSEFTPPMFYRVWELSTVQTGNEEGDWFTWKITPAMKVMDIDEKNRAVGYNLVMKAKEYAIDAAKGLLKRDLTADDLSPTANTDQADNERM